MNVQGMTDEGTDRQAHALLEYVDSRAEANSRGPINERSAERRALRARCTVYYPARDGSTVLSTPGKTRDISANGIGFLSRKQLIAKTRLRIVVVLDDGREFRLSAVVVRSHNIREDWYLTGAMLENRKPNDTRQVPGSTAESDG